MLTGSVNRMLTGLLLAALIAALVSGCSRGDDAGASDDDLQLTLTVQPEPPAMGPAELVVTILTADGEPVSGASLEIEGNMSHAGMEPVFVEAPEDAPGIYVSQGFEFTMSGDWIIIISGELADGSEIRRTFDLRNVAS